jgi:phosphohistidine phosphatase SixA
MTAMIDRRLLLLSPLALTLPATARADEAAAALLRRGGVVAAFRHATAPGTYDPPGFRLDDCSTQRNLSDEGRAQSRRLGDWFRQRQLGPKAVRSSPWCRCIDTATLAFGNTERWAALGSPREVSESAGAEHLALLRQALLRARTQPGFEAWVTHMFVLSDLVGTGTASGEGLVLQADAQGRPAVVGRIVVA